MDKPDPTHAIICRPIQDLTFVVAGSKPMPCYWCSRAVMASPASRRDALDPGIELVCWECAKARGPNLPFDVSARTADELARLSPDLASRVLAMRGMPAQEVMVDPEDQ